MTCVICDSEVIIGSDYIKACQLLGVKVNTFICDNVKKSNLKKYLLSDYGKYYYEQIKRNTYVQGLAQLYRSTIKKKGKKQQASTLYEKYVIPYLASKDEDKRILDFGCGKGDYITMLSKNYDAVGIEFFNNNGKTVNITKGNMLIDNLLRCLKQNKQFDIVVCDSVLNSVDSGKAEESVIGCLNLFCSNKLFISGRPLETVLNKYNLKTDRYNAKRFLEFLDDNNFTANYRKGQWYFQHYHTKDQITNLLIKNGFKIVKMDWAKNGDSFQIEADKVNELSDKQYIDAVNFEFDLPLPNGRSYNRNKEVLEVMGLHVKR